MPAIEAAPKPAPSGTSVDLDVPFSENNGDELVGTFVFVLNPDTELDTSPNVFNTLSLVVCLDTFVSVASESIFDDDGMLLSVGLLSITTLLTISSVVG